MNQHWQLQIAQKSLKKQEKIRSIQQFIPDLTGKSEEDARAELLELGLTLSVIGTIEVSSDSGLEGLIAGQNPTVGTMVDDGSVVTVDLGVVTPEEPPPDDGDG